MSYTPSVEEMRDYYANIPGWAIDGTEASKRRQVRAEAFDRMLAALIREAKAEAWDEGHEAGWGSRDDDVSRGWVPSGIYESDAMNPYREGSET